MTTYSHNDDIPTTTANAATGEYTTTHDGEVVAKGVAPEVVPADPRTRVAQKDCRECGGTGARPNGESASGYSLRDVSAEPLRTEASAERLEELAARCNRIANTVDTESAFKLYEYPELADILRAYVVARAELLRIAGPPCDHCGGKRAIEHSLEQVTRRHFSRHPEWPDGEQWLRRNR